MALPPEQYARELRFRLALHGPIDASSVAPGNHGCGRRALTAVWHAEGRPSIGSVNSVAEPCRTEPYHSEGHILLRMAVR